MDSRIVPAYGISISVQALSRILITESWQPYRIDAYTRSPHGRRA